MSKVDVLEALDGAIAQTEYHNAERAHGGDARNRPLREARDAVAELIDALDAIASEYENGRGTGMDRAMQAYDMRCLARAALANIGSTK